MMDVLSREYNRETGQLRGTEHVREISADKTLESTRRDATVRAIASRPDNFTSIQNCISKVFGRLYVYGSQAERDRHIYIHNRHDRPLCRAQTAVDYSAFMDYVGRWAGGASRRFAPRRVASRRPVPAQYRGEVARIMTDEGDVINDGPLLFYRRTRDEIVARGGTAAIRTGSKAPRCHLILELSCKTLRFQRRGVEDPGPFIPLRLNAFP